MGHRINGAELSRQLALRGTEKQELARAAGVSPATITSCLAGRPVSTRTLRAIATALHEMEPLAGVEALLAQNGQPGYTSAAEVPTPTAVEKEAAGDITTTQPQRQQ
jgi:DNA-binding Xre family transcriptional regulator